MPKISVIIPCYNQGQYIHDALNSIFAQTFQDIEIIIVNDGSTDEETIECLQKINHPQVKIIHQENKGLAEARNTGIKNSVGKYILPLDADDKIAPTYLEKAYEIIEKNQKIGIVYCEADFFGAQEGLWNLPEYKFPDILERNCIFCTALFRKSDWEKVGGYKKEMIYGWEDFEFWLSLIENGAEVYRIPEVLFHYRKHQVSMTTQMDGEKRGYLWNQIRKFHKDLYEENYKQQKKDKNLSRIFSIKNEYIGDTKRKIINIFGLKIKIKIKDRINNKYL